MRHRCLFGGALLSLGWLTGCRDLDSVGGHELGEANSVAYADNDAGQVMVVFSDMADLCSALQSSDPPASEQFWVMSAWTHSTATAEGEYSGEAYFAAIEGGHPEEYEADSMTLELKSVRKNTLKGKVTAHFGDDRVRARFEAERCDAALFTGVE